MASLMELPTELCDAILSRLERPDLKRLRLASRECAKLVTPLVFQEILFDLDPGGCDGLVAMAQKPELARHVQIIHLRRRAGMKVFTGEDDWYRANIHEYIPDRDEEPVEPILDPTGRMSKSRWKQLGRLERFMLWQKYQSDLEYIEEYFTGLATALSAQIMPNPHDRRQTTFRSCSAWNLLDAFTSAVRALSAVHTLAHTPTFEHANWGRTWRNLEFHPRELKLNTDEGIDPRIDALQLFISRRHVLQTQNPLRRIELYTEDDALWSVPRLRELLDWGLWPDEVLSDGRNEQGLKRWVDRVGGLYVAMQYAEILARELFAFERRVSSLESLKCCTAMGFHSDTSTYIETAAALSSVLRQAVQLKELELGFRQAWYFHMDDILWHPHDPDRVPSEWAGVSDRLLLGLGSSLQYLRRLDLSLVTSIPPLLAFLGELRHLRHLGFSRTALLPGGRWETVLTWIAEHLSLESVQLHALEDLIGREARMILNPKLPALEAGDHIPCSPWTKEKAAIVWREYEDSIVDYVLRRSHTVPVLDLYDFLEQWCDRMYPTDKERYGEESSSEDGE